MNDYVHKSIKQDMIIYMLRIAGQTAGPIGLKFFIDTHGWPGGVINEKKLNFSSQNFFYGQRRGPSASVFMNSFLHTIFFNLKRLQAFSCRIYAPVPFVEKPQLKLIGFQNYTH